MITTIPLWKMLIETKGKVYGLAIAATSPVLCAGGALMFLEGLQIDKARTATLGLITAIFLAWVQLLRLSQDANIFQASHFQAIDQNKPKFRNL
ncbi:MULTISPECIES: hypothetical protein [unclassified Pseudomonas]|uniref:hypothetical protein n=1 Tax=unclassified Pseudomonas TaxID=196821 RepID=UPI001D137D45|nr:MULTISPECIES: hypothetical protein [unclassified Pseudomonas]